MVSAFVSRDFGMGIKLTKEELKEANERRMSNEWGFCLSKIEANNIYGLTKKKTGKLTLVSFFDVEVNLEGFWNYDQMALQVEDIFDVLAIKYPEFDILFLFDQSSGHGKMREGALNANTMSVRWGGRQGRLRKTKINEIGTYAATLRVGDEQGMIFEDDDVGPFYLTDNQRLKQKYDWKTGERRVVEKNKKEIKDELRKKGYIVRGHCCKDELHNLATSYSIELTKNVEVVEEGWCGKPKGLLQVLWERGMIDETNFSVINLDLYYLLNTRKNFV